MTINHIKLLAIITMVIDHIGLFFFPHAIWMRWVGRISFPLFAWLIANGAKHTRNFEGYLGRLLLLALISQIPFMLANRVIDPSFAYLNVVFTLSFGLGVIYLIKRYGNTFLTIAATVLACALAQALAMDYGAFGILLIVAFYVFYESKLLTLIGAGSVLAATFAGYLLLTSHTLDIRPFFYASRYEIIGLLSLLPILSYDAKEKPKWKMLFYYFYPLQYVVFYLLLTL
jgi:hypothetical protein